MKTKYGIAGRITMAALVAVSLFSMVGSAVALSNSGGGSWQYYKEITVSENSGSTLMAYQVLVQLSSSNFPTNARSDGADIRFTDASNNELSYWIESWDYAGRSAKIWVKVPNIPASAATTIRLYYGNPSAGSSSSGDATFDLYDDFSGTSLDVSKWSSSGTISVSSGELSLYGLGWIKSNAEFSENIIEETRSKAGGGVGYYIGFRNDAVTKYITVRGSNGADPFHWDTSNGVTWHGSNDFDPIAPYDTAYHLWKLEKNGIASAKIYQDGNLKYNLNQDLPSASGLKAFFMGGEYSGTYYYTYVDWVRIRKYASSEPTLTLGAEQPVSVPDTTPPSISISSPSNGQSFTTDTITVTGTASDNIALSKVEVKVGTGSWQLASGTTSWSKQITLSSGSNTIYARATDTSGNIAQTSATVGYNPSAIVAEYHFDGNAQDSSGNGNHGVISGATFVQGISGQALSFDGLDDYVNMGDNPSLRINGPYTVEAWVYSNQNNLGQIVSKSRLHDLRNYELLWLDEGNGGPKIKFEFSINGVTYWTYSQLLKYKEWYYVAGVYDGAYMKLYVNGNQVAITPASGMVDVNTEPLTVGRRSDGIRFFNGIIDEVRIYNRALTTSEIQTNYNAPTATPTPTTPTPTPTPTPALTPTVTPTQTPTPTTPAVIPPMLTVSHTTSKEKPEVGEEVLITVTVLNEGEGAAKNIRLTEQLPSSVTVSYIEGATSNTPNLVTWNGELAPNRAHAILHTLKIVEKKSIDIPVTIRYEDEAGKPGQTSTTIHVGAQPTATPTPEWTKAPESTPRVTIPGFTGLLVLIGLMAAIALVRRR